MSCSLLHHNTLRFPPPHKYPVCSVLPLIPDYCLAVACWPRCACSLAHTYAAGHLADQMNREVLSSHSIISAWPHMQRCECLLHPDVHGFTTGAAHACWGYCIAHVCSRCSSILEQCFVNPARRKSENISSSETETSPGGYRLFMQVLVE